VYGPVLEAEKAAFLDELREARAACDGPWLVVGDFNMIYQVADKSNGRLNLRAMRRFRHVLDALQLSELYLHGRRFTWSNEHRHPTLERIDRAFASVAWLQSFSCHRLRSLSSDCSDHAPLLLDLCTEPWARLRFRFESIWVRFDGFMEVVSSAWVCTLPHVDHCRALDYLLRRTAKALKCWSAKHVGSIRFQLFAAREIVAQLDVAQESRPLSDEEHDLRKELKRESLGLASLARTIARQRSRIRFLGEGDANTRFFHLQACHRNRKNTITALQQDGQWITAEDAKADLIYDYYSDILGKPFTRSHGINFQHLGIPQLELEHLGDCFSEAEIWETIKELPNDRAPGPDGFTGIFYKVAWPIIKVQILNAFNQLWSLDGRSFYLLNDALMVLLRKTPEPSSLKDYRPISLMHSFAKLLSKCLARRLAPLLATLVRNNQSAFIKGRCIHDNFTTVSLTCKWLHARRFPCLLIKVDIAKAFDSVSWPFLLELLRHIGFPQRWTDLLSILLSSASTKVLVNGRPGRRLCHARGLRQGDPLSPMLFVIVMEVLNSLIVEADRRRIFSRLPGDAIQQRASLYADDLVVFLAPTAHDLQCLRAILDCFAGASGLVTNVDKCLATPIRCSDEEVAQLQAVFPCRLAPFPCRYLGVPLSISRLPRAQE